MRLANILRIGLALCAVASVADAEPLAFVGARVWTVSDGVLERGTVVIEDGRIAAVGPVDAVEVPDGAEVRDTSGQVLIPGLVDTHSHIGIYPRPLVPAHRDGNDTVKPVQPQLRAIDAIWPEDPGIRMARAGGITTANIMPGSGNVVGGQTAYVKLRGRTIDEMLIHAEGVQGGMKMANGENPKRAHGAQGKPPMTRMAIAALERDLFQRAIEYRRKWDAWREAEEPDPSKQPVRDFGLDAVLEILAGERTVHHHTHRADDILSVLRLREEFDFRLVLHHATEAYKVVDEIAAAGVPVSLIMLDSPGGKLEAAEWRPDYAAVLERAGVEVAIHSDDFITPSRLFLRSGAMAVRAGLDEEAALRALTLAGARMLELDGRLGSIEVGKDADLVLLSGPPFSVRTQVLETWIEGEPVFRRSDPEQRQWATGGLGLGSAWSRASPLLPLRGRALP